MSHSVETVKNSAETIETQLLIQAVLMRYGYDFTDYHVDSIEHRLSRFQQDYNISGRCNVIEKILRDQSMFHRLLPYFSISVTSMFRDPSFYRELVEQVFPLLKTWPRIKIWHAGCATGEEVYSLAILLSEAGLLDRATIYATDISQAALETAKAGIYASSVLKKGSENYHQAGGEFSLSEYYRVNNDSGIIAKTLRDKITFARHNLAMDKSFGDMHLILCRNVLIYFNDNLKNRVLEMFQDSLENSGYLALGQTESLCFSSVSNEFEPIDDNSRIYKSRKLQFLSQL